MARDFNFNLTEAETQEGGGFQPVPEGRYDVEIVEAEEVDGYKNGAHYKLQLKSLDDSFAGLLFFDLYITPGTLIRAVKGIVEAAGLEPVPSKDDQRVPDADDFVGRELNVEVKHTKGKGKHEGKTFANVQLFGIKPVGGGGGAKKSAGGGFDL